MSSIEDLDAEDFNERINRYPFATMKLQYAENYFNKFDYDMLTVRPNQSDEVFIALTTRNDDFRTIICSHYFNVNKDIEESLMNFYYKAEGLLKEYERQEKEIRSQVQADTDQSIEVDDDELPVECGQYVLVAEG